MCGIQTVDPTLPVAPTATELNAMSLPMEKWLTDRFINSWKVLLGADFQTYPSDIGLIYRDRSFLDFFQQNPKQKP